MTSTLDTRSGPAASPSDRSDTAVPWSHVITLAVVLSFANGFWIVSLRGAVGSIERTSEPFSAWLRESTILVPWYAVAVLVALALALRWFGPRPRGLAGTSGTIALLVSASTLAGTLVLLASSFLDYRLQVHHLADMAQTHADCDAACVSEQAQATLQLGLKAVLVGVALMAATSLVVVLLTVAFRGGRIIAGRPRTEGTKRSVDQRVLLAASLLGAAAIHAAMMPEHFNEWTAAGVFFLVLAIAELAATVAVVSHRPRMAELSLYAAVAVSVTPLLLWLVSRTTGLPFGPEAWVPEPVGLADVMSSILEVAALVLAIRLILAGPARNRSPYSLAIALAAMLSATTLGIGGSSLPVVNLLPGVDLGHHAETDDAGGTLG